MCNLYISKCFSLYNWCALSVIVGKRKGEWWRNVSKWIYKHMSMYSYVLWIWHIPTITFKHIKVLDIVKRHNRTSPIQMASRYRIAGRWARKAHFWRVWAGSASVLKIIIFILSNNTRHRADTGFVACRCAWCADVFGGRGKFLFSFRWYILVIFVGFTSAFSASDISPYKFYLSLSLPF